MLHAEIAPAADISAAFPSLVLHSHLYRSLLKRIPRFLRCPVELRLDWSFFLRAHYFARHNCLPSDYSISLHVCLEPHPWSLCQQLTEASQFQKCTHFFLTALCSFPALLSIYFCLDSPEASFRACLSCKKQATDVGKVIVRVAA